MGSSGDKPRKPRHHLRKVPKYAEANSIHLAGLTESGDGESGNRLGHSTANGRSQDVGRLGRILLWCLGRRRKPLDAEQNEGE